MRSHTLEALSSLSEAVATLRTWISDHPAPGQDTSALVDVDERIHDCDVSIRAAYRSNELPSPNISGWKQWQCPECGATVGTEGAVQHQSGCKLFAALRAGHASITKAAKEGAD